MLALMRIRIATCLFIYGLVGTMLGLLFQFFWIEPQEVLPGNFTFWMTVFVIHCGVLCATFQIYPSRGFWRPVVAPTRRNVRTARLLFFVAIAHLLFRFLALIAVGRESNPRVSTMILSFIDGLFLLSSVYITIHWALRPENLFSPPVLRFLSNPLWETGRFVYDLLRRNYDH